MTNEAPPSPLDSLNHSVIAQPEEATGIPSALTGFIMWAVAQASDEFIGWGSAPKQRDKQLRDFIPQETYFASALGIVSSRNSAMSWEVVGDEATAEASHEMLNNANHGGGWEEFISQTSTDLYTQDTGAYVELMRETDDPASPVVGLAHLDAARCFLTGQPEEPVWYQDMNGRFHPLKWFQVVQLLEQPSPITPASLGFFMKLQYSALTRVLKAAQILRSIEIYRDEKISGRFTRGVHLLQGVSEEQVTEALARSSVQADAMGLMRYAGPTMVGATDPGATVGVTTVDVATMPDGFDESEAIKNYITVLAMGFGTDYQEFAPLPGGNLGTSAQSEVLHAKSRGKGPGLFRSLITRLMNMHGVLPKNVQFQFTEQDIEAEAQEAAVAQTRAETRKTRIESGEITAGAAQQLALDVGDLSEPVFEMLRAEAAAAGEGGGDITPEVVIDGEDVAGVGERGVRTVVPDIPLTLGEDIIERLAVSMEAAPGRKSFERSVVEIEGVNTVRDALEASGLWDVQIAAALAAPASALALRRIQAGMKQEPVFEGEGERPEDIPPDDFEVPGPATTDERAGPTDERMALEADAESEIGDMLDETLRIIARRWAAEPVPTTA
jgi:hypothetical protein